MKRWIFILASLVLLAAGCVRKDLLEPGHHHGSEVFISIDIDVDVDTDVETGDDPDLYKNILKYLNSLSYIFILGFTFVTASSSIT